MPLTFELYVSVCALAPGIGGLSVTSKSLNIR